MTQRQTNDKISEESENLSGVKSLFGGFPTRALLYIKVRARMFFVPLTYSLTKGVRRTQDVASCSALRENTQLQPTDVQQVAVIVPTVFQKSLFCTAIEARLLCVWASNVLHLGVKWKTGEMNSFF